MQIGCQKDELTQGGVSVPIENENGRVFPSSFKVVVEEFGDPAHLGIDKFVADFYDVESAFLNG